MIFFAVAVAFLAGLGAGYKFCCFDTEIAWKMSEWRRKGPE